jgi:hypothetical protein
MDSFYPIFGRMSAPIAALLGRDKGDLSLYSIAARRQTWKAKGLRIQADPAGGP